MLKNKTLSMLGFLKIISDEKRWKILYALKNKELNVKEVAESQKIPHNMASHHLQVLKRYKLILSRKSGKETYYKIDFSLMATYCGIFNKVINPLKK